MYKELTDETLAKLKEAPFIFVDNEENNAKRVVRGEFGKKTFPKAPGCLVLFDFGQPSDLKDGFGRKKPVIEATCYLISKGAKSQIDSEDAALLLLEKTEDRLTGEEILVSRFDGTQEYNRWEFEGAEWIERKQNGCVIALTLKMELWK